MAFAGGVVNSVGIISDLGFKGRDVVQRNIGEAITDNKKWRAKVAKGTKKVTTATIKTTKKILKNPVTYSVIAASALVSMAGKEVKTFKADPNLYIGQFAPWDFSQLMTIAIALSFCRSLCPASSTIINCLGSSALSYKL